MPGSEFVPFRALVPKKRRFQHRSRMKPSASAGGMGDDGVVRLTPSLGTSGRSLRHSWQVALRPPAPSLHREVCDLFLRDTAQSCAPVDDRAMAWSLVQTNTVMEARRALPFRGVFPVLCSRLMDIGQLVAVATLLADEEQGGASDYVAPPTRARSLGVAVAGLMSCVGEARLNLEGVSARSSRFASASKDPDLDREST